jgi:uncharacterized protein
MQIPVSHGRLEANLRQAEGPLRGAAVICHPHPLHGGTMHTKAVFRTAQALSEAGFHVVRFNFRGVGTSTGSYDDGIGEQDDVRAALDWLEERYPSLPILVGGFSFGSFVGLRVGAEDDRVKGLLGLGLPVEMWDFSFLEGVAKPLLVVQGEEDRFGRGEAVAEYLEGIRGQAGEGPAVTLVRISGSDHFFNDRFDELQEAVREWFSGGEGGEAFPTAR